MAHPRRLALLKLEILQPRGPFPINNGPPGLKSACIGSQGRKTLGAEIPYAENKGDKLIHSSLCADTVFHDVSRTEGPKGHPYATMYVPPSVATRSHSHSLSQRVVSPVLLSRFPSTGSGRRLASLSLKVKGR